MSISSLIKRAAIGGAAALAATVVAAAPASAASKDRNHDKIPDRWEVRHGLSLDKNQARKDQDGDSLRNMGEFRAKFDPRDSDTDDDSVKDGDEGAGTIESFDAVTGTLVIKPFIGPTVTGTVTADTEIECDNDDDVQPDDEGDDGPDDDVDDDHSDDGPGHDVGDDHSGPSEDRVNRRHGDDDENCSVDDLTVGTVVREAELELTAAGPIFEEIEL